jgi:hypothetical protein
MAIIRLIILITVLGGLTLLLAQNFSPTLPLIFLGVQTPAFPLAMWILFSVVAGAATSLFIGSLFGLSSYFERKQPTTAKSAPAKSANTPRPTINPPPSGQKREFRNDTDGDWDLDGNSDDWDFEEQTKQKATPRSQTTQSRDSHDDQRQAQPKTTSSPDDSAYSYSYREPKNSGVGKTESIYDADYRVIIPPYQPEPSNPPQKDEPKDEDDDWGLFEEDEASDVQDSR